jgi:hypothetical protein
MCTNNNDTSAGSTASSVVQVHHKLMFPRPYPHPPHYRMGIVREDTASSLSVAATATSSSSSSSTSSRDIGSVSSSVLSYTDCIEEEKKEKNCFLRLHQEPKKNSSRGGGGVGLIFASSFPSSVLPPQPRRMITMNNTVYATTGSTIGSKNTITTASSVKLLDDNNDNNTNKLFCLSHPYSPHRRMSIVREHTASSSSIAAATSTSSSDGSTSTSDTESVSSSVLSYIDCIEEDDAEEEHDLYELLGLHQETKNKSSRGVGGGSSSSSSPSSVLPQPRRMIFTQYWKDNTPSSFSPAIAPAVVSSSVAVSDVPTFHPAGLIREPRSPLLEHYPSSSSSSSSSPSSSPSAKITVDGVSTPPRRRSIFAQHAQAQSQSQSQQRKPSEESSLESILSIDSFRELFTSSRSQSSHRHITVLSSSSTSLDIVDKPLALSRRNRSNSCPEKKLTSCLKRRSHYCGSSSNIKDKEQQQDEHDEEGILYQRHRLSSSSLSVTFDSHIEVVAFECETTSSIEEVDQRYNDNGSSWTDHFLFKNR